MYDLWWQEEPRLQALVVLCFFGHKAHPDEDMGFRSVEEITTRSVSCYLLSGAVEMLEKGTSSMQVYVLHMLYLLLLRREASSASLVINAQGANWREAARVYKVIVEQWQNTERDNTTIASRWYGQASTASEQRVPSSLPRRLMCPTPGAVRGMKSDPASSQNGGEVTSGFELDLSLVSAACGSRPSPPSPRKNVSTLDTTGTSTIGSVKKAAPPHVRVRDRLVGLLSASGLRVGLPSAVSVVFSQSELGSTASSTERICTSSQEVASTTSLPDPSASITDSFPRVFKEFDFLEAEHDSVSETADSCFGWLSTMRPRSIGGDEPQHDDDADVDEDEDSESAQANSEGGGASTSRLSRTSISSDRTPCPSEVDEEEDEGDDGFGDISSQADQKQDRLSPPSALSRDALEKRPGDRLNGVDEESIDGSSYCCRSRASLGEFYSPKATPTSPVDATWISLVTELQDDSEGELTAYATLLFTQLFRLRCSGVLPRLKLSLFELREHWETFNERKEQSIRILNSVKSAYKLNALVGSSSSLTSNSETELSKLLSKLLFQLMLMSDSLNDMVRLVNESHGAQGDDGFGDISSQADQKQDRLSPPSALSRDALEKRPGDRLNGVDEESIDGSSYCCRSRASLGEFYSPKATPTSPAYTLSPAVLDHQRELLLCVSDLPPCDLPTSSRPEHSGDSLVLLMTNKRYSQALLALRSLRQAFGPEYGCCEASDIDVLLLLFCRSHSLKAWALVGAAPEALRRQSQSLRDANADVASAVRRMASDSVTSHRASTTSSLTESFQKISYLPD
ncbi:hypothetical protein ANCCEY_07584 [Ancylostoma ceylanicum]|uniref:Protein furry C-terminal domain-containing protein n=1 Tax=Ancylostoma ceylanicum TaxID=53326 RepID=A0A0D6LQ66_9BILA|nr:hypothetical protein ANCCEY_07584 [Ancylostoma ceylanicum]